MGRIILKLEKTLEVDFKFCICTQTNENQSWNCIPLKGDWPEVLWECNTSIDTGFPGRYRHITGVGDQGCPPHNALSLPSDLHGELGEILEYFTHLISTFSTPDIDDDVRVGVLGEGLGDYGFTATESSGDSCCTSLQYI